MIKIDIDYVKKLFKYIDEHEVIYIPYYIDKNYVADEIKIESRKFLDKVGKYADANNIPEIVGSEKGCDNRYYYIVEYNNVALELGLLYDGDIVYVKQARDYDPEDVIRCNDIFKKKKTKKMVLESEEDKIEKEDK